MQRASSIRRTPQLNTVPVLVTIFVLASLLSACRPSSRAAQPALPQATATPRQLAAVPPTLAPIAVPATLTVAPTTTATLPPPTHTPRPSPTAIPPTATALPPTAPPPTAVPPTEAPPPTATPAGPGWPDGVVTATLLSVTDGDTVKVTLNGRTENVRLIGVDTPETVDPRSPVQCFGREASDYAKSALTPGLTVGLESDPTQDNRDKYDRLLRYIWLPDGVLFNLQTIAAGYAHEYTYSQPYKYQSQFKDAERQAREAEIGLWSPTTCAGNTQQAAAQPAPAPAPQQPPAQPAPGVVVPAPAPPQPAPRQPAAPAPAPAPARGNCDPSYPTVCIAPYPPDLDCGDISYTNFRVVGRDPHRFDGDKDGVGCESR